MLDFPPDVFMVSISDDRKFRVLDRPLGGEAMTRVAVVMQI